MHLQAHKDMHQTTQLQRAKLEHCFILLEIYVRI